MLKRRLWPAPLIFLVLALVLPITACTKSNNAANPTTADTSTTSTTSNAASTSASSAETAAFSDCSSQFQAAISSDRANRITFSCAKIPVPLDYARPAGTKIDIFVVKAHLQDQDPEQRIGSLLVNPGGPGASGVNLAAGLVTELDESVLQHFDLVGFDPRGVNLSAPIDCISDAQKDAYNAQDPDVRTAAGRAAAKQESATISRACVTKYGHDLSEYNTAYTARDMDAVRQAVGDATMNYLGFSYGTRLGAAYAHLFPTKIRTAVLDGAVDPVTPEIQVDERQAAGFESAFNQFAADCLKRPACAVLGNPRSTVVNLIKSADKNPIASSVSSDTRTATGGIVTIAVASALYDESRWNALGQALIAATHGDAKQLFALADAYTERDPETGHYSNVMDANLAINCNDSTLRVTDSVVAAKAAEWSTKYPIFGMNAAASLYACAGWPPSGHPLPSAAAPGARPILVVGTVHDPATPFGASAILAKALGSGVVLSWNGEGHTAYPKTACVTTKVNSYLISGTIPAGHSCPAS